MRDLAVLLMHLLATVARLAGPGGARSVVAESMLVKHQLLILNRARRRSLCLPNSPLLLIPLIFRAVTEYAFDDHGCLPLASADPQRLCAIARSCTWRCWPYVISCRCCNDRGLEGCGSPERIGCCGSGCRVCGTSGVRRWSSSARDRHRLAPLRLPCIIGAGRVGNGWADRFRVTSGR
jgi:hypothetical protein